MNTTHHVFSVDDAVKHGVEKAILLYNIRFWLQKEQSNSLGDNPKAKIEKHTDGKEYVWTYNSSEAFADLFPYLSRRSISRYLQELEDCGELISGNFNKFKYDKTKWYTMGPFELHNLANPLANLANRCTENGQPIPYINTDINTNDSIYHSDVDNESTSQVPDMNILTIGNGKKHRTLRKKIVKEIDPAEKEMNNSINHLLGYFNQFNPGVGYVNKTHRSSLKTLIGIHGVEEVKKMVNKAFETNGKDYAPVITTPTDLLNKLSKLIIFLKKNQ